MLELFGLPVGTLSQFGTFTLLLILTAGLATVWVKGIPERLRVKNEGKAIDNAEMAGLRREVAEVRGDLKKCEAECADELRKVHEELWGMRKQNIAEQISLINIILNSVDAPELKAMLKVLESVKATLNARVFIDPAKSDQLNVAEHAVMDAQQTVRTAKQTVTEVKRSEDGE